MSGSGKLLPSGGTHWPPAGQALRILVVDDDKQQRDSMISIVSGWGHETAGAINGVDALEVMERFEPSVILTDLKMPRMDGFELLRRLRESGNFPPTIVLTAFGSLDMALSTVHDLGGFWFLEKPVSVNALELLLERAGAQSNLVKENQILRRDLSLRGVLCDLVGVSAPMQEVFQTIRQVAPTDAPVLITGESGTGKELAARAIHSLSPRKGGPFIAVNCAALPETLVESEIFGHEKGAFTGASDRRIGCIEMAENGTLFLDELAEMPVQMQAKLLRVLQDFRYRRLGGKQEMVADVRVVAATNRPPKEAIEQGSLREDLYYRLTVFHIALPPLRDRPEDIEPLVQAMVNTFNAKYQTKVTAPDGVALEFLRSRRWDGNVRELRNVLERAVIVAGEGELTPAHLQPAHRGAPMAADSSNGLGVAVGMTIDEAEQLLIEATLEHAGNNKTRAAAILGISAKTLHAKLRQYRLQSADE
ncbi:MAG: sigma-54 dependent transcriptional regulator [Bryobacteraceae bacterium]